MFEDNTIYRNLVDKYWWIKFNATDGNTMTVELRVYDKPSIKKTIKVETANAVRTAETLNELTEWYNLGDGRYEELGYTDFYDETHRFDILSTDGQDISDFFFKNESPIRCCTRVSLTELNEFIGSADNRFSKGVLWVEINEDNDQQSAVVDNWNRIRDKCIADDGFVWATVSVYDKIKPIPEPRFSLFLRE